MEDIKLTYETLYEISRLEKSRPELQELSQTFFIDALAYLKEKQRILEETKFKTDIFSSTEREKTITQIRNIKKLLNELYERRESKILAMAINKSRTQANIVDTSALLPEERKFYETLLHDLNLFREGVVFNILEGNQPTILSPAERAALHSKRLAEKGIQENKDDAEPPAAQVEPSASGQNNSMEEPRKATNTDGRQTNRVPVDTTTPLSNEQEAQDPPQDSSRKIKFLTTVDKFFGKQLEAYGPYTTDEITEVPAEIADVLIENGQATPI